MNDQLGAHEEWVRRLARQLAGEDGDDLAQELWLSALRSPPASGRPLKPWLKAVLHHLLRRDRNRATARLARERSVARSLFTEPPSHLEEEEVLSILRSEWEQLEEPYRGLLFARFHEGRTAAAIARAQDVPAGTVRWRVQNGLVLLRRRVLARLRPRRTPAFAWFLLPLGSTGVAKAAVVVVATGIGAGSAWRLFGDAGDTIPVVASRSGLGEDGSRSTPAGSRESAQHDGDWKFERSLASPGLPVISPSVRLPMQDVPDRLEPLQWLRVVDRSGRPLPDFRLDVFQSDRCLELCTDEFGEIRIDGWQSGVRIRPRDCEVLQHEWWGRSSSGDDVRTLRDRRGELAVDAGPTLSIRWIGGDASGPVPCWAVLVRGDVELARTVVRALGTNEGGPHGSDVQSGRREESRYFLRFGPELVQRSPLGLEGCRVELFDGDDQWVGSATLDRDSADDVVVERGVGVERSCGSPHLLVRTHSGDPIPEIEVWLDGRPVGVTDANGACVLEALSVARRLHLRSPGWRLASPELDGAVPVVLRAGRMTVEAEPAWEP